MISINKSLGATMAHLYIRYYNITTKEVTTLYKRVDLVSLNIHNIIARKAPCF